MIVPEIVTSLHGLTISPLCMCVCVCVCARARVRHCLGLLY